MRAWVTQPCRLYSPREQANPKASEEAFNICCLYKGIRIPSSSLTPSLCLRLSNLEIQRPSSHLLSVKEEDITKLRAAGYLAKEIAHRLPAEGQVVPTPEPTERVVFIPHFFPGLGFPLHPFVCGLMYYYGIDFHDLSPNSFLNISAFIVACEAFLHIHPHFGLWLKVFNVKPKVVDGQHAECGEAMVSKLPNVSRPKGTFVETVKEWQKQWFYITEPRGTTWSVAVEFRSGAPMRLTSWVEKSPDWCSPDELIVL